MARLFHPDMHPEDTAGYTAKFQEITAAYETLSDSYKKELYDLRYHQYVLGEDVHGETYEDPEVTYHYYQQYQPPAEPKRRKYVPYGAFLVLAFYFIRIISNAISASSVPEQNYHYEPLPPTIPTDYFKQPQDTSLRAPALKGNVIKRPF